MPAKALNRIAASTTAPPTSVVTLAVSTSSNHTQSGASKTSAAQDLLLYARRLLRLSDEAVASLRQTDAAGTVRLGLPEDYAAYLLRPTLARFGQDYPLAQIELTFSFSPTLLRLLETGKLALALVTRDPRQPFAILRRERFVWAASPEHSAWSETPSPWPCSRLATSRAVSRSRRCPPSTPASRRGRESPRRLPSCCATSRPATCTRTA